jgi:NADH-quinone oxidoreductase subunit L
VLIWLVPPSGTDWFVIYMLTLTFTFPPLLLLLNCFFISIYREWLGAYGTYVSSMLTCTLALILIFIEIDSFYDASSYAFVDFGRYFYAVDLIDSHFVFCIDSLALFASALVILLTTFALTFGLEYMYREAFVTRLIYLLNLFATSVVFLFFSYDYFFILISWESMGLFSYLLVNFYSQRVYTIKAAIKTFIFARISDLFMFGAFVLTLLVFHTTDLTSIFVQMPFKVSYFIYILGWQFQVLSLLAFSLAFAGGIKGAQFFSHVWLPDAMEAPTPASALIHSSTLVIAGVFLIIRFNAIFEFTTTVNCFLVAWGSLTLAFGSVVASAQYDIKKLVAYSTISQVGYLICGCGFCCYEEVFIYLVLHALNKAFLFILVGYIVHFFLGNTDMRHMGGVYSYMFDLTVFLFTTAFNLTGLPYSAGYVGKEFLLFHMIRDDILALAARASILISLFFTPVYMHILVFVVMFGPKRGFIGAYSSH